VLCVVAAVAALAQPPQWIWHPAVTNDSADSPVLFRHVFRTPPLMWNARLTASADDTAEFFLNGRLVATCERWDRPVRAEVSVNLNQGENVLAVKARNRAGPGGLLVHLNLGGERGAVVVSDTNWLTSTNETPGWNTLAFPATGWTTPAVLGPHGITPWGEVFFRAAATPAESIEVPAGYAVELLRSAEPGEGSWICLAFDDRGRLYLSAEDPEVPVLRVTFDDRGEVGRLEPLPAPLRQAMGLLYAHDSLYVNGRGPEGLGLYRLSDANRNDRFDPEEVRLLKRFSVGGEHGYHALALGPDGWIYVLNGNMTRPPEDLAPRSPFRHAGEDVLSLNPDELGDVSGIRPPAGYVARTDPDGQHWEVAVGGLRNAYGFDFNPDGELFTFDSDNEWNWGTPWYVPTRVLHCVAAADFGWRDGLRIWPDYYPDTLPPVVNVGIGSPCGVRFGTRSRFASRHRRALFLQDWSYGRILAVHLTPEGASYRGTVEHFLSGRPLNHTAMDFGPDGALYFTTGGRGTQSGLYRVRYVGPEPAVAAPSTLVPNAPEAAAEAASRQARALRRHLERFHGRTDAAAVNTAWPHLGSADPFLRHAARVALEAQPFERWRSRALAETNVTASLTALLAWARVSPKTDPEALWTALGRFAFATLDLDQRRLKARALQVALVRGGRPAAAAGDHLITELEPHYPGDDWPLNRELARLLLFLEAPQAVPRSLDLLASSPFPEQQLFLISQLRHARAGWTLADRRRLLGWWHEPRGDTRHPPELLRWFADVERRYVDGASVDRYLTEMHRDTVAGLGEEERAALADVLERPIAQAHLVPATQRAFVQEWTVPDLLPFLDETRAVCDEAQVRQTIADVQCLACHRLGDEGGASGPELTGVGSKYRPRDILESILEPSKVVSEQYQNWSLELADGDEVSGRLISETAERIILETDWRTGAQTRVRRDDVKRFRPSSLSPMPEGLVNVLTREEILDLVAYLAAGAGTVGSALKN
jgi:putative heme-binding domain-containing protein